MLLLSLSVCRSYCYAFDEARCLLLDMKPAICYLRLPICEVCGSSFSNACSMRSFSSIAAQSYCLVQGLKKEDRGNPNSCRSGEVRKHQNLLRLFCFTVCTVMVLCP